MQPKNAFPPSNRASLSWNVFFTKQKSTVNSLFNQMVMVMVAITSHRKAIPLTETPGRSHRIWAYNRKVKLWASDRKAGPLTERPLRDKQRVVGETRHLLERQSLSKIAVMIPHRKVIQIEILYFTAVLSIIMCIICNILLFATQM